MKIRTIALNTFGSFLRNKVILLFCSLFVCIVALMTSPLLYYKSMTDASNAQQMQGVILNTVAAVISMVSGFGSLLAAWAAADSVAGEMKSGTVLAVMARPLRRWEFMAGKYLGVLMLMAVYVTFMLGVTFFWPGWAARVSIPQCGCCWCIPWCAMRSGQRSQCFWLLCCTLFSSSALSRFWPHWYRFLDLRTPPCRIGFACRCIWHFL